MDSALGSPDDLIPDSPERDEQLRDAIRSVLDTKGHKRDSTEVESDARWIGFERGRTPTRDTKATMDQGLLYDTSISSTGNLDTAYVNTCARAEETQEFRQSKVTTLAGSSDISPHQNEDSSSLLTDEVLEAIKKAGYIFTRKPSSTGFDGKGHSESASKPSEGSVQCPECSGLKDQPRALSIHMQRHLRPYGCTFRGCKRSLRSKQAWRRHEMLTHYRRGAWRCKEAGCSKVCTRVSYRTHLSEFHMISNAAELDRKSNLSLPIPLWCGFCKTAIHLDQNGIDAESQRFNHIDDHFMGRNGEQCQSILNWVYEDVEEDVEEDVKGDIEAGGKRTLSPVRKSFDGSHTRSSSVSSFTMSEDTSQPTSEKRNMSYDEQIFHNLYTEIRSGQQNGLSHSQKTLVDQLMQEVPKLFNNRWSSLCSTHLPADSAIDDSGHCEKLAGNEFTPELSTDTERSRREDPYHEYKRRWRTRSRSAIHSEEDLRLACPFRKYNSAKYNIQDYRSCAVSSWPSIARLKEHIYRTHRKPIQCRRCWQQFKEQDELDDHITAKDICKIKAGVVADGITSKDEALLKSRKRSSPNQSEEDRWQEIYRIIFPGENPNGDMPSAIFNPIKEEVTTVPVSEDVTYYERYSRRELHVYFRRWLENAAMAEEDPEKLRANLISMISRFGDRVFKQDRGHDRASTDTTSDPAPPLSPWLQYQGFTFSSDLSASAVGMPPMDIPLMIPSPENMKSTLRDCCFEWPYCTCIRWDQYGVNQFPLKSAVTNTDAPACDPRDPDLNQQFWQDLDGQMSSLVPSCDPDLDWLTSFLGDRPT